MGHFINNLKSLRWSRWCRNSHRRCSMKSTVLKIFAIFTGKHLCCSLFLIKLQAFRHAIYEKETVTQVFSYEYCEIFKNTYFEKHLRTATPDDGMMWVLINISINQVRKIFTSFPSGFGLNLLVSWPSIFRLFNDSFLRVAFIEIPVNWFATKIS